MPVPTSKIHTANISWIGTTLSRHHHAPSHGHLSSYHNSSGDDSDDVPTPSYSTTLRLRASIASASETRLREVMVRLVDRSPGFQHAVAKELLGHGPMTTYHTTSSPRRKRRRSGRRSLDAQPSKRPCTNCGQHISDDDAIVNPCHYHPGTLQGEMYEFPSRTPGGHAFQVTRKIFMWSCCDEDAESPGCASAPAHVRLEGRTRAASVGVARSGLRDKERSREVVSP